MTINKGCIPTSSSCIIWNGPQIDCIDHCQNESIEDIVYRLSKIVCQLQTDGCDCEPSLENMNCVLRDGGVISFDLFSYLTFLFTDYCDSLQGIPIGIETVNNKTIAIEEELASLLPLPTCLQYKDDGTLVTELTYSDYILLLATHICNLYDTIASQNDTIVDIQNDIDIIQQWITDYTPNEPITITSGCASAANPGEVVEISVAFETFEANYCDYIAVLGSTTDWNNALSAMCPNLPAEPQMQDLALNMSDLPSWVITPTTVADNYSNMWATICDLRTALQTLLESNAVLPCITATPENLTIDTYDEVSATLSWSASSLAGIQDPIGFLLEIYEWNGVSQGNLIYSTSYAGNIFTGNIISAGIIANVDYLVKLSAVYSCGQSAYTSIIGQLKDSISIYQIDVSEVSDAGVTTDCDDGGGAVAYPYITTTTTLDLINIGTGSPTTLATDLSVILTYTINHPDYGVFTQNVAVTIPAGSDTVDYEYVSEQTILSIAGNCETLTKTLTCGLGINNSACIFGTGIVEC